MKVPLLRDVPPRAAAVVIALALLASVVSGSQWIDRPSPAAELPTQAPVKPTVSVPQELDLASLERRKISGRVPDLFAMPSAATPPSVHPASAAATRAAATPTVPPVPPLPFRYLGKMDDGERLVVFLEKGPNVYSAAVGDTLENAYRVQSITEGSIVFRHLTHGTPQTLAVPPNR